MIAQADTATSVKRLHDVLHLAGKHPVVLERLRSDLRAGLEALGVHIDAEMIKTIAGIPGASDAELVEIVKNRAAEIGDHDSGTGLGDLRHLLDRAETDPPLLRRVAYDPLVELESSGVHVDCNLMKELMGLWATTDMELLEVMLSRTAAQYAACCNG
jgi:hypothetical protein